MSKAAEIQKLLPNLTPEERKQIRAALDACDKVEGVSSSTAKPLVQMNDADMLLHVFCKTLTGLGLAPPPPAMLHKSNSYPSFAQKGQQIIDTLREAGLTDRVELEIALELGINLLYYDVKGWASAVTPRILMTNFDRVLPCINAQFPDYLRNGLARWIAGAHHGRKQTPVSPFTE